MSACIKLTRHTYSFVTNFSTLSLQIHVIFQANEKLREIFNKHGDVVSRYLQTSQLAAAAIQSASAVTPSSSKNTETGNNASNTGNKIIEVEVLRSALKLFDSDTKTSYDKTELDKDSGRLCEMVDASGKVNIAKGMCAEIISRLSDKHDKKFGLNHLKMKLVSISDDPKSFAAFIDKLVNLKYNLRNNVNILMTQRSGVEEVRVQRKHSTGFLPNRPFNETKNVAFSRLSGGGDR